MKSNNFFNAFPPPDFLNVPYAGLSISDTAIRCIQFSKKNNNLLISKYTEMVVPPGLVVSGLISNVTEVSNILETIKKDLNLGYVKVSLPEEKAYLFTAKIPMVENKEVRNAVEFKMEENVPVSPSELLFDYTVTDSHSHTDHINVVVSALPITVVDTYIETVRGAGIEILSLEIESQAIARAIIDSKDSGTHLIIHFNKTKVGLYVASNNVVHFTSTILDTHTSAGDLSTLVVEIKKLYIYWHTLKENAGDPNKKINQIIVCGEDVGDEIVPYLSAHTTTPTILGNVWVNAFDINKSVPQISFDNSLRYAPAVGLALPSDILL